MAYVAPPTKTANDGFTAAEFNQNVRDNVEFLYEPPRCLLNRSGNQSISNNTVTALDFNLEELDNDAMHSLVTNTSRVTANTAGLYMVSAGVEFASNSTGKRTLSLRLNGSFTIVTQDVDAADGGVTRMSVSTMYYLDVNDYVEAVVLQTSGGALNSVAPTDIPFFRVAWIGG